MDSIKRLFDCVEYHLERSPLEDMLAGKENGNWKKFSTNDVSETINKLSAGLLNSGIADMGKSPEEKDKVCIISKNRPEWLMVDMALQKIGAVPTPVYPTININELEFILYDAEVKIIFVNDEALFEKVSSIKNSSSNPGCC